MKIIDPKVTKVLDFEGTDNFYKSVARAARICYASDKTTDDIELIKRLIYNGHYSPFAHAIVYVSRNKYYGLDYYDEVMNDIFEECRLNKYAIKIPCKFSCLEDFVYIINGRVIVESIDSVINNYKHNNFTSNFDVLEKFLQYLKHYELIPDACHRFLSFIVDTSIGCTREIGTHHDDFYKCEQSTRYCNFSKDKFGGEVAFNRPYWIEKENDQSSEYKLWKSSMQIAEKNYVDMLSLGMTTDQTRGVLPIDTHSRAILTATTNEWNHFIRLRLKGYTGKPHGDIAIIAGMINEMIN